MDWHAWMYKVREYEERTFADYIDGGYDMYAAEDYDRYETEEDDRWHDETYYTTQGGTENDLSRQPVPERD